jgi:hypothetical protein
MQRATVVVMSVVLFFVFYALFSSPPTPERTQFFTTWGVALLVGFFLACFLFFLWRLSRGLKPAIEGNRALMRGDFKAAVELAGEGVRLSPGMATPHYVLAQALAYSMRLHEAKAAFARAAIASGAKRISASYAPLEELIAALLGEVPKSPEVQGPEVVLAHAVRACRAGRWEDAKGLLQSEPMKLLWATNLELREVLLAWCEEQLGGPPRKVDVSLLTREGVADPSSWWPELGDRVKAHRLS